MEAHMTISEAGLRFIAGFEGFRPLPYNDPAGHATIGYGHLLHKGPVDGSEPEWARRGISQAEGLALLRQDVSLRYAAPLAAALKVAVSQPQFDALCSWIFNVGVGWLRFSDLMKRLNAGDYAAVPGELDRFVYSTRQDGVRVKLAGLVRRRRLEGRLFAEGIYEEEAVTERQLKVPYRSQLGANAVHGIGDCGPASLAMLLGYAGILATVDQVSHKLGLGKGFTSVSVDKLQGVSTKFGLSTSDGQAGGTGFLVEQVKLGRPIICLINYTGLTHRYDKTYRAPHFIVVVGYRPARDGTGLEFIYHDPYWPSADQGAYCWADDYELDAAWTKTSKEMPRARRYIIPTATWSQ